MADIKPFQCIRPEKELAKHVASLPYDVYNRSEACEKVKGRELLFLNICLLYTSPSPRDS